MIHVVYNALIYTLDTHNPTASALAIEDDRIIAVGYDREILTDFNNNGQAQNLEGRIIIPGLTDAHIHLEKFTLNLQAVDCETETRSECLRRIAARARVVTPGTWILGHGWNQNNWEEGYGNAPLLDEFAPNNPVYLTAKSLHAGWANSIALRKGDITSNTPDPEGGKIQRNEDGNPTGILFEDAMSLISSVIPEPTTEEIARAIYDAQRALWALGLTGVHDFDRRTCFSALQILHNRGDLRLRVVKSIPLSDLPHAVALGLRSGFGDDFLRIGMVKAFADGALGPQTAAMLQPYENEPDNRGMLLLDAEEILGHARIAVDNGLGMVIHAIGDRANHEVLNAYEHLRNYEDRNNILHLRHRIEHVQLLHPDDFTRLANLGIIASMQPIHATSDMNSADQFWGNRASNAYAWRSLLKENTMLAFGSDAPVESPNPFWGIHAAVTRQRPDGSPHPQGWYPEQKLTRLESIQGYTTGPAFAAGMENQLGVLSPGFLADLIVLEKDPFTCHYSELRDISPVATMVGGEWVYQNGQSL